MQKYHIMTEKLKLTQKKSNHNQKSLEKKRVCLFDTPLLKAITWTVTSDPCSGLHAGRHP